MIIGPNAPIVVEPIRSSFFNHAYDFYKPDPRNQIITILLVAFLHSLVLDFLGTEFPTVDGHMSINTYLNAIDNNYKTINEKCKAAGQPMFSLDDIQYGCFHAPFAKMVQKAFVRLFFNDLK